MGNDNFNKLTEKEQIDYLIRKQKLHIIFNDYGQAPKIIEELKLMSKTPSDFYLAVKLYNYLPNNMYYTEKLESVKANLRLRKQLKLPQIHKDYIVRFTKPVFNNEGLATNIHVEAGMQIEIIKKETYPTRIITFNAFFTNEKKQRILRINNLQGTRNSITELNELTHKIGENWRIRIVKDLNQICVAKEIRLIGELPKFYVSGKKDTEYLRILRQYIQTYLKAGLKPENIDITKIKEHKVKTKIEKIIINKEKNKVIHEKRDAKNKNKPKIPRPLRKL